MPRRPPSHSERLGRQASDAAYERRRREVHDTIDTDAPVRALALARQLRHAKRWERVRQLVLKRHPTCADPYGWHAQDGRVVLAQQVDHILPLATHPHLAYDLANLQGLCTQCHATKSAQERG